MKHRVLAVLLSALWIAAALAGCGGGSGGTSQPSEGGAPSSPGAGGEPHKIVFWHSMADEAGVQLAEYVAQFNDGPGRELGIAVEAVFQGAYVDSGAKLRAILQNGQTGQLPDVMQLDATGMVDYQSSEAAWTVDDARALDPDYEIGQILEAPLGVWRYGSRQLGLPFSASTTVMYYNKTLLEQAGVAQPPTTFDEIIQAADKLPGENAAGVPLHVYAQMPNTANLANWIGQIPGDGAGASYIVDGKNGREEAATKLICDEEGTLATFLSGWKRMYDAGALTNMGDGLSDLFYAGQLVFYTASTSQLQTVLTTVGDSFEVGCAYFPRIDENSRFGAVISGSGVFMFNKGDDAQAQAGWEWVKYLTSADIQAKLSVATGYFPVNRDSYATDLYREAAARVPQMEVGVRQVEETSPDMMNVTVGPSRDFYYEIQNQVSDMLTSGRSAEEAIPAIAAALNGLLEQYQRANR